LTGGQQAGGPVVPLSPVADVAMPVGSLGLVRWRQLAAWSTTGD
jgi:hypothetical protein